jgi:hypothetical protein
VDGARPEGKWVAREVVEFHDAPPSAAGSALYATASTVALASPTSTDRRPSRGVITNTVISRRLRRRRWSTTTAASDPRPAMCLTLFRLSLPQRLLAQRIELRLAAGVSRAIPRRIHGVRLAITATAQSDRRIAVPEAIGVVPADQLSVVQSVPSCLCRPAAYMCSTPTPRSAS